MCICKRIRICMCICICMCIFICICVCKCLCICIWKCWCAGCIYIYMCVCVLNFKFGLIWQWYDMPYLLQVFPNRWVTSWRRSCSSCWAIPASPGPSWRSPARSRATRTTACATWRVNRSSTWPKSPMRWDGGWYWMMDGWLPFMFVKQSYTTLIFVNTVVYTSHLWWFRGWFVVLF